MEILYGLAAFLFYLYFLTYIFMQVIQPIGAICRLYTAERLDSNYAIGLKKYLLSVTIYFAILFFLVQIEPYYDLLYVRLFYLLLVPWTLAIWYIRYIRIWKKKRINIRAFDKQKLLDAANEDPILLESYQKKKVNLKHHTTNLGLDNANSKKAVIKTLPNLNLAN